MQLLLMFLRIVCVAVVEDLEAGAALLEAWRSHTLDAG